MGVPAFFRWLSRKYPSIVVECIETSEVDYSGKNPNGVEFDNLYIDMNGIIHPCTHPENGPVPQSEDEMMLAIFYSIDRIFKIVRPRKLLYLAVDGVAPRAKVNQQRSRRFRAAKEAEKTAELICATRRKLIAQGVDLPLEVNNTNIFDSNCITPGTAFMYRLTKCLNYYILDRITNDKGWKQIKVILSDASVSGEGEHKIMDFIRRQRAHPDHNPNTHHCICGADADLIMLGLATHEPYFTIIREEFVLKTKNTCLICGKTGHSLANCNGTFEADSSFESETEKSINKYIFIRLNVLREYLEQELSMPGLPFEYEFERAIDDWVFMCFFVGNDFLPHLPSLEIREGAIDRLINLYKMTMYRTNGFITHHGNVNIDRLQIILNELGKMEDAIFKKRHTNELKQKHNERTKKMLGTTQRMFSIQDQMEIAHKIEPIDEIKLWESGYKERYYRLKFNIGNEVEEIYKIALEYVRGLCWVLKYYYQGCASWKWYYPYNYAPFASDFVNISQTNTVFEKGTHPFAALEQLMGVFPPSSSSLVPINWADLMVNPLSPILDFYPKEFVIDLNGKRFAWQGVALLPFVDENRLKKALSTVYTDLTDAEVNRNKCGHDRLYMGVESDCFKLINNLDPFIYQYKKNPIISDGVHGDVYIKGEEFFQGETIPAPVNGVNSIERNSAICVAYTDPQYPEGYVFKSSKLAGVREPPRVLYVNQQRISQSYYFPMSNEQRHLNNFTDLCNYNRTFVRTNYPLIGMAPLKNRAFLSDSGHRMLRHAINHSQNNNKRQRTNQFNYKSVDNSFHRYNS